MLCCIQWFYKGRKSWSCYEPTYFCTKLCYSQLPNPITSCLMIHLQLPWHNLEYFPINTSDVTMSTFVPILILLQLFLSLLIQAFEDCPDEFKGLSQFESCQCQDSVIGQDIWCPNSEKPKVRFRVQQEAMWIDCHNVDETELKYGFLKKSFRASLLWEMAKKVPAKKLVWGIGDLLEVLNDTKLILND